MQMEAQDKIAESLGIRPMSEIEVYEEPSQLEMMDESNQLLEDANEDYREVRQNIKDLIEDGMSVFEIIKLEALAGAEANTVNAFSKIFDSMIKANKELMNIHKDMLDLTPPIKEEPVQQQQADQINNIIFTGSAADLFKKLKDMGVKTERNNELTTTSIEE